MATKLLRLEVVTPDHSALSIDCDMVVVQSISGEMGFLPDHAPLIAALVPQILRYTLDKQTSYFFVSGGFVEIKDNIVSIITPAAESSTEIDYKRAEQAKERALERLKNREHIDVARAEAALLRANARLSMQHI